MIRFQILKSRCSVPNTGSLTIVESYAFRRKIQNYTAVCDYLNQKICLGIDEIVTRGILNPDGPVPRVKMCSSLESEHYLPPGGNGGMQWDYLCSAQGFSRGKKRDMMNNMVKRYVLKWECGKIWMKRERQYHLGGQWFKLVLPQQSESSRETPSGWL